MKNQLVIGISGRLQSGKSSMGKYIFSEYVNKKIGKKRFILSKLGKEVVIIDTFKNNSTLILDQPTKESKQLAETYSVKLYSFADSLKEMCINVLGLDPNQCYGTDDDKNTPTHIYWEDLPTEIRQKYSKQRRGKSEVKPASGPMTARNVMQVVGTDIFRTIDYNCWARAAYNKIEQDKYNLSIITDVRFPNEVTIGTENDAKIIRLTRVVGPPQHESETALDNFAHGEFTKIIENQELSMDETHNVLKPTLYEWFARYNIA